MDTDDLRTEADESAARWRRAVAAQLRAELSAARLSVAAAAERSGLSKSTVGRYTRAKRSPTISHLVQICDVLDISISDLLARAEERLDS